MITHIFAHFPGMAEIWLSYSHIVGLNSMMLANAHKTEPSRRAYDALITQVLQACAPHSLKALSPNTLTLGSSGATRGGSSPLARILL